MNKRVKGMWLDALRSGDYEQGTDALHRSGRFCCLGVLCELAHREGVVERYGGTRSGEEYRYGRSGETGTLPPEVREWAGLDRRNPRVVPPGGWDTWTLAGLNDDGASFDEIADVIEEQL